MRHAMRFRFWLEIAMATITGVLFMVTLFVRNWIEIVFHVSLDNDTGSLEWMIVGVLLIATVTFAVLARYEWRRAQNAISATGLGQAKLE